MKSFNYFYTKHFPAIFSLILLVFVALSCSFKSDNDWKQQLGGKKLTFAKTTGSISDKIDIYFCGNGMYAKRTEFTGVSGEFTMADAKVERGLWNIESGYLLLENEKKELTEYSISQNFDNDIVQLSGKNYRVSTHNQCN